MIRTNSLRKYYSNDIIHVRIFIVQSVEHFLVKNGVCSVICKIVNNSNCIVYMKKI